MQQTPPSPPQPPSPIPISIQTGAGQGIAVPTTGGPSAIYEALRDQRSELRNQLDDLEEKRSDLVRSLSRDDDVAGREGTQARIKALDARIAVTDAQLAQADAAVARAAAMPGAVVPPAPIPHTTDVEELYGMSLVFTGVILFPLMVAYARRLWKRGATVIAPVPQDVRDRLNELTNAVESIGLEVERIGEGQRFITKVFSEQQPRARVEAGAQQ